MRSLNTYPACRPSGVEWLGDVPEHWEVRRLEYVASYRTSSVDKKAEDGEDAGQAVQLHRRVLPGP